MSYTFDYRLLSETLYDALIEDAFYITMEGSVSGLPNQRREAMLRYYDFSMQEARKYGQLVAPTGRGVGAAIWSKPVNDVLAEQMVDEKKAFIRNHMGAASLDTYTQITAFMAQQTATVVPPTNWYLSIVGIAPPFQGKGLGGTLVRPVLDQADDCGVHTYLETFTPRNMRFYARLGFQEAGSFDEPETKARYWVMVRKPL